MMSMLTLFGRNEMCSTVLAIILENSYHFTNYHDNDHIHILNTVDMNAKNTSNSFNCFKIIWMIYKASTIFKLFEVILSWTCCSSCFESSMQISFQNSTVPRKICKVVMTIIWIVIFFRRYSRSIIIRTILCISIHFIV